MGFARPKGGELLQNLATLGLLYTIRHMSLFWGKISVAFICHWHPGSADSSSVATEVSCDWE